MKRIASACGIAWIAATSVTAQAWQSDVHYDLTRHLARLAGYSATDAETIAAADQGMDEDPNFNAIPLVGQKILFGSRKEAEDAFHVVRQWHFAADNKQPGSASTRAVLPDAKDPRDALSKCESLQSIGRWLHAYQDSWSHQSEPGILAPWRKELQWAHPTSRDGPYTTRADLTNLHPVDAMEMAVASYERLQACAKKGKPSQLPDVERDRIAQCFDKETKVGKLHCYKASASPGFKGRVSALALPNGRDFPMDAAPRILSAEEAGPARVNAGEGVPKAVADQALALVERAVLRDSRGASLMTVPYTDADAAPMQRVLDQFHRRDRFGPTALDEDSNRIVFPSLSSAIVALSSRESTIDVTNLAMVEDAKGHGDFAAAFQYRHQPYDVILVLFDERDGVLKVRRTLVFGI